MWEKTGEEKNLKKGKKERGETRLSILGTAQFEKL